MKKILFTLLTHACVGILLFGQEKLPSIERQVFANAGGYFPGNGYSITWTLGEPIVETLKGGNLIILTQGFQQPDALPAVVAVEEVSVGSFGVKLYPNPADMCVTIEANKAELLPLQMTLFDLNGRSLAQQLLTNAMTEVNVSKFPSGVYFMRLISPATRKSTTVKFQKIR